MKGQLSLAFKDVILATFIKYFIAVSWGTNLGQSLFSLQTVYNKTPLLFWVPLSHHIFAKEEEKSQQNKQTNEKKYYFHQIVISHCPILPQ